MGRGPWHLLPQSTSYEQRNRNWQAGNRDAAKGRALAWRLSCLYGGLAVFSCEHLVCANMCISNKENTGMKLVKNVVHPLCSLFCQRGPTWTQPAGLTLTRPARAAWQRHRHGGEQVRMLSMWDASGALPKCTDIGMFGNPASGEAQQAVEDAIGRQ